MGIHVSIITMYLINNFRSQFRGECLYNKR